MTDFGQIETVAGSAIRASVSAALLGGLLFSGAARGATYWVGPSGSDSNAGSESAPFASLTNALAKTDVTEIRLLEGDYTEIPTAASTRGNNFASADVIAEVTKAVKIVGAGREKTILRCRTATDRNRCGIYLNNKDASLTGVTIRDGGNRMPSGGSSGCVGWGIDVAAGVVSNCAVICGAKLSSKSGEGNGNQMPAFALSGANAFAYDCVISNHHYQATNMKDALVYVSNGLLRDSLITDCWGSERSQGHGLYLAGGTVRNCTISHNDGTAVTDDKVFAGGVYMTGGTLADCRILGNHQSNRYGSSGSAGGCYATGGVVTNCLFAGNRDESCVSSASAGGLNLANANAKAYDCTFAENTSFTGGAQLRIGAGTASNMLVERLNGVPTCEQAGGTLTGLVESASPGFRDRTDFELPYASAYRTAGWHRPTAPTGVEVALLAGRYCYRAGENVVVTAKVTNGTATGYAWKVTTASGATTPTAGDELTLTKPACGDYTIEVEAKNGDASLGKVSIPVLVRPAKCYVKATGGDGTWPYDSTDTAPCCIQKAVDAVYADEETRGDVEIAEGTYANLEQQQPLSTGVSCRYLIITKNVHVRGETGNPDDVWFKVDNKTTYMGGVVLANVHAMMSAMKLTMTGTKYDSTWWMMSHGLEVGAGTVSNVVVTGCSQYNHFIAPVCVEKKGVMTHSVVRDNTYSSGCGRRTAGVLVRNGGRLFSSSILRNSIPVDKGDQIKGNGVYVTGSASVVSNCIVEGNSGGGAQAASAGGVWMDSGTVEKCIIQCNTNSVVSAAQTAGGVYFAGGTIRNCLIAGNYLATTSTDSAGGIYVNTTATSAKAHHLTVVSNGSAAGDGVVSKGTALAGSVSANNGGTQVEVASGTPSYCCYAEATEDVGVGNTSKPVNFVDSSVAFPVTWETVSNYGITKVSGGYNIVKAQYATEDLLGTARPAIDEESTDFPDAGALEVVQSTALEAYLVASAESYAAGQTAVFTVSLDGACTTIGSVEWTVTTNGVTTVTTNASDTLTLANVRVGDFTVAAVVENTDGEKAAQKSLTRRVSPRLCYVALGGTNVWPYDSEAIAASNVFDAVEAVYGESGNPGKVVVLPGTYGMAQKTSGSKTYLGVLSKPVHVIGRDGPAATVIRQTADGTDTGAGFMVTHAEALIAGLTVTGSYYMLGSDLYEGNASAFVVADGIVSNCVATGLYSSTPAGSHCVPAVLVTGGAVLDCRVVGNGHNSGHGRAAPVYLKSGLVSGCEVSGNWDDGYPGAQHGDCAAAGGVWVAGGVLTNSVIRGNRCTFASTANDAFTAGGVKMTGGEMWNCVISCNTNDSTRDASPASGLAVHGRAKVRNCLVEGNVYDGTCVRSPAVHVERMKNGYTDWYYGEIANVTVTDNVNLYAGAAVTGVRVANGAAYNTIVWNNSGVGADVTNAVVGADATVSHCCYPEATENADGNVAADPRLKLNRAGETVLRSSSPCIDAGLLRDWMTSAATDLNGRPRVRGPRPDMGCAEGLRSGHVLFLR